MLHPYIHCGHQRLKVTHSAPSRGVGRVALHKSCPRGDAPAAAPRRAHGPLRLPFESHLGTWAPGQALRWKDEQSAVLLSGTRRLVWGADEETTMSIQRGIDTDFCPAGVAQWLGGDR